MFDFWMDFTKMKRWNCATLLVTKIIFEKKRVKREKTFSASCILKKSE